MPARADGAIAAAPGALLASDDLFKIVWRSRWLMLTCIAVALTAGFAYIQTATPIYRSTSKLYVQQGVSLIPGVAPNGPYRYNINTQAGLLRSTPILNAALERPGLREMRTFASIDNPLAYLDQNVQVSVGKNDDIVAISLECPYPVEAAEIVNGIVTAFMTHHEESKHKSSADVLEGLQKQRDQTQQRLSAKRGELARMKKTSTLLTMELDQGGVVTQELQGLSTALAEARIRTIEAYASYEGVKARAARAAELREYVQSPGATTLVDSSVGQRTALLNSLLELRSKHAAFLNNDLTANHPQVRAVDSEIQRLEARLTSLDDEFVSTQLAAAEQRYLDAKKREEGISGLFEERRQQALALNDQLIDYRLVASEVEELTQYLGTLQQQISQINLHDDLALEPLKIQVMEVARPAESPAEPQKGRAMAIALVLGLVAGGGLAVVRDWLNQTLRSADEISALLGLSVLGIVPAMPRREKLQVRGRKVHLQPDSQSAEAFRTLRTAVFFGAPKERARTLLITSPAPGDGKSTVVSNLAIAMAQAGQRTLVVDADFRKPLQHTLFGVNHGDLGVGAVLAGKVKLSQAIQPAGIQGLSLLVAGEHVVNPAEVLTSRRFARLLQCLARAFDRIIIDAPPVMAVADAQIIGALCDRTILVLQADKSTRRISQRAIDALQSVGAQLLGVVVNNVGRDGGRYGYYAAHGAYYGSGRDRARAAEAEQRKAPEERIRPALPVNC